MSNPQNVSTLFGEWLSSFTGEFEQKHGTALDTDPSGDIDAAMDAADHAATPTRAEKCERCDYHGRLRGGRFCVCPYGRRRHRYEQERATSRLERAGVPDRLRGLTLDSWDEVTDDDPEKKSARRFVAQIVARGKTQEPDTGRERRSLLLHGRNGVGKSGLMAALAHRIYTSRHVILWVRYEGLIRDIQASYSERDINTDAALMAVQRAPILFIDDLGRPFASPERFRESEDRRELTYEVISYRHERDLPTFITTNLSGLPGINKQFDGRIADRIMEMCTVCEMGGKNLRRPS